MIKQLYNELRITLAIASLFSIAIIGLCIDLNIRLRAIEYADCERENEYRVEVGRVTDSIMECCLLDLIIESQRISQ